MIGCDRTLVYIYIYIYILVVHSLFENNDTKSMMGEIQLQWFFDEIQSAAQSHDLVFWVSSVPYTAPETSGKDHWGGFTTERTRIANFIKNNDIDNLMIISGDAHSVAAGDGSDADYADGGGVPLAEILAAPLSNNSTSVKGGPWSQGTWRAPSGTNAYGFVTVEIGSSQVTVRYKGRSNDHTDRITLTKTFNTSSATPSRAVTPRCGTVTEKHQKATIYSLEGRYIGTVTVDSHLNPLESMPHITSRFVILKTTNGRTRKLDLSR